ncbi:hypothetical protein BP422_13140 [Brevibacillus formosus]|uniref:PBSX phage terminase small subunit-like N-terminal domain-containing protein n=1 Tax=Brevibacillus formosus TaxID=54913 RepID=A0A220MHA0_9BACL|nr:phage terminase small subunit [Brevibacillus formosus]ASJ54418.1 hypothetical protein BP422_13140 [Brevibacillus formosus]
MARERSPNRGKALKLWLDSGGEMLLKDIAAQLGVSDAQIRKWKKADDWEAKLKGYVPNPNGYVTNDSNSHVPKRIGPPLGNKNALGNRGGRGAPKGNKYAVGNNGGAPLRNQNAVRTGEFRTLWMDALSPEELERLQNVDPDPISQAIKTIVQCEWRESGMIEEIQAIRRGLLDKERRVTQERVAQKDAIPVTDPKTGQSTTISVTREALVVTKIEEIEASSSKRILDIEEALTRVVDKRLKAADMLARLTDGMRQAQLEKIYHSIEIEREKLRITRERFEIEKAAIENKEGDISALDRFLQGIDDIVNEADADGA